MATLTIRNLSDDIVQRIKQSAYHQGHSMEQEVRELLEYRYASRKDILHRAKGRWEKLPSVDAEDIARWRHVGRP